MLAHSYLALAMVIVLCMLLFCNYSYICWHRTSDIFRAFVVLVRAKVDVLRQYMYVPAKILVWCAYITGHENVPVVYL